MRASWLVGALPLLAACSVGSLADRKSSATRNSCQVDPDCGPSGQCVDGMCRSALDGEFHTLLFEVTPPADASSIAGVQFLEEVGGIDTRGGPLDLALDVSARLTGQASPAATQTCTPSFVDADGQALVASADGSIPVSVSLTPSASLLGLFAPTYVARASLSSDGSFTFAQSLPAGDYDVYAEPFAQAEAGCVVPPQLFRHLSIKSGTLKLVLPEPATVDLHVHWPSADAALDGWSVDLLDASSGRLISNRVLLRGTVSAGQTDYAASVVYSPAVEAEPAQTGQQYVRLSPPKGVSAPTVLMARDALSLFSANRAQIDQFTVLPEPIELSGQVTGTGGTPVAATVTLVASKISGIDAGIFASFVRTLDTAEDGTFSLSVLPGTYRAYVTAAPSLGLAATTNAVWEVAATPAVQSGKRIELGAMATIQGSAVDPAGRDPVTGATVHASASPASVRRSLLDQAFGVIPFVPRTSTFVPPSSSVALEALGGDVTDDQGRFQLRADPGTYDVSVRPEPSSGFAWFLRPSVQVSEAAAGAPPAAIDLGRMVLPLPVHYSGLVSVPGAQADTRTPLRGSLLRAYCYLDANGNVTDQSMDAQSVLQVAETRVDDQGLFELLIPAKLNPISN